MIISVEELRQFITTDESNTVLQAMLEGLESFILAYTHNDFKNRTTGVVAYPADVKMGVVNLMKWDLSSRDKVSVSSETISRHSVTYADQTGENMIGGYPSALVGFLKPYMKARF